MRYCRREENILLLERGGHLRMDRNGVKIRRTRASFTRSPGALKDGWLEERYCTSMVIVWLAATSAWSFVAPVTVIWCVPLLKPLNVPWKPF